MKKVIALLCLLGTGLCISHVVPAGAVTDAVADANTTFAARHSFPVRPHTASAHPPRSGDGGSLGAPASDLYVDTAAGDDANDGLTPGTAFRTIQRAADIAAPGTVVNVLPGVYRETVRPQADGTLGDPIEYRAHNGPGSVVVRGSEPSASLSWEPLGDNAIGLPQAVDPGSVYVADLSGWGLDDAGPRFVVLLDAGGAVSLRLPLAREPDWHVETAWRHHEFWWTADGGLDVSPCDPSAAGADWTCDRATRCTTRLTDRNVYPEPDPAIEAGDLTTLGDLTGAELVSLDAKWGHYLFRRRIVSHDVDAGRITVDGVCLQDGGYSDPGLGWGSKYYIEDHPALLDSPGEWWYDLTTRRLYLWPPAPGSPGGQAIEISRRDTGVDLTNRSYVTLDGLTVELYDENAVDQTNYWAEKSHGNTLRNLTLRYANHGVFIQQSVRGDQSPDNVTRDLELLDSEIAHMDTHGLFMSPWWDGAPDPTGFPWSGVYDVTIRGNEFHHLGFEAGEDNAIGLEIQFPDRITFEDNHVHDIAHNGVQFLWSVIDSSKTYGFDPSEIKTGEILVKGNLFEDACQLTTDCGALKFWGQPPDNHVFRDVLVTGNTFRNVAGWSYVASERVGWWAGGERCQVNGQAGFGLYLDYASGIHAYRNLSYNNSYAGIMLAGTWRDGDLVLANNTVANSLYGFRLSGVEADTHGGNVNTQLLSNMILGSEGYGIYQCTSEADFGALLIDHSLYYNNGWRPYDDGGVWQPGDMAIRTPQGQTYYPSLADIQNHPYHWEAHGVEGNPVLSSYDANDHDPYDGSLPDFRLTSDSDLAIDHGAPLPASLIALLSRFAVQDPMVGSAYDIGWREGGVRVSVHPTFQSMSPGESVGFTISVAFTGGEVGPMTLTAGSPDPQLHLSLSPSVVTEDTAAGLIFTSTPHIAAGDYVAPISATAEGFEKGLAVQILVVSDRVYLPQLLRY